MADLEDYECKYRHLLQEFNDSREKIANEKENQLREFEKYRAHLDRTYKQMEKKYEAKLHEERATIEKRLRKAEAIWKQKEEEMSTIIQNKDRFIEELKRRIVEHEAEKHQIIQDNTKMLYDLCQDMENSEQSLGPHKNSYQDLLRLYQFVLQENNSLKKQLFMRQMISKQPTTQNQQKQLQSQAGTAMKKQEKKKKKASPKEADDIKSHNQSIRAKVGQLKKQGSKRAN